MPNIFKFAAFSLLCSPATQATPASFGFRYLSSQKIAPSQWEVKDPYYFVGNEKFQISAWVNPASQVSNNLCRSFGFKSAVQADTGVYPIPDLMKPFNFVIVTDDLDIESIHRSENPNSIHLLFWSGLTCTK